MNSEWKQHPELSGIDPVKLELLQTLAEKGLQKSPSELMMFLMQAVQTQQSSMKFTSDEITKIISVLKEGKSSEELAKIDKMLQLMNTLHKTSSPHSFFDLPNTKGR